MRINSTLKIFTFLQAISFATFTNAQLDAATELKSFFSNLSAKSTADSIGFTYFTAKRNDSLYTANFTSFFHGTCYPLSGDSRKPYPASRTSLFRVASITKIYVGTAIYQLVDKDLIKVEDPVSKYLPELSSQMKSAPGREPTVFDLLQHTTGIEDRVVGVIVQEFTKSTPVQSIFTAFMSKPGEKVAYSNIGVAILGAIVERVSGKSLSVYLREMLTSVYQEQGLNVDEMKFGFTSDLVKRDELKSVCFSKVPMYEPKALVSPAMGDFITNSEDLARFMAAHVMNSSAIFKKSETFQASRSLEGTGRIFQSGFAKLWEIYDYKGIQIITKMGNIFEFNALAWFVPALGEGGAFTFSGGTSYPSFANITSIIDALHPEFRNRSSSLLKYTATKSENLKSTIAKTIGIYQSYRIAYTGIAKFVPFFGFSNSGLKIEASSDPQISIKATFHKITQAYVAVDVPGIATDTLTFVSPAGESMITVKFNKPPLTDASAFVIEANADEQGTYFPVSGLDAFITGAVLLGFEVVSWLLAIGLAITACVDLYKRKKQPKFSKVSVSETDPTPELRSELNTKTVTRRMELTLNIAAIISGVFALMIIIVLASIASSLVATLVTGKIAPLAVLESCLLLFTISGFSFVALLITGLIISSEIRGSYSKVWFGFVALFGVAIILGTIELANLNFLVFRFW